MEEGRKLAGVGATQRRLVCAPQQRERLERRRSLARVHSIDRRGDGLPHAKERLVTASRVAPERGSRAGAPAGLFSGLCTLEVPGPTLPEGWSRQRTATRPERVE